MSYPSGALPAPTYLGGMEPMTTTPMVGEVGPGRASIFVPGAETLSPGEMRLTVLGSGDPWIRRSQASGSLLIEVVTLRMISSSSISARDRSRTSPR